MVGATGVSGWFGWWRTQDDGADGRSAAQLPLENANRVADCNGGPKFSPGQSLLILLCEAPKAWS